MGRQLLTLVGLVALAGCAMPGGSVAGGPTPDPLRTEYLNSGRPNGIEGFSQVVRMGPTVYVSGQVALDGDGKLVGAGNLRAQATQALENLSHALTIAGATAADVAKITVYVVNLTPADWSACSSTATASWGPIAWGSPITSARCAGSSRADVAWGPGNGG